MKKNNYGAKFLTNDQRAYFLRYLFKFLGVHFNELLTYSSNKPSKTYVKAFHSEDFSSIFELAQSKRSLLKSKQNYNIKDVSGINKADSSTLDLFSFSFVKLRQKKLDKTNQLGIFPVFNAQVISDYIAEQVSLPETQKSLSFKKGLLSGIAKFTMLLLKQVKISKSSVISGLKIECSGK